MSVIQDRSEECTVVVDLDVGSRDRRKPEDVLAINRDIRDAEVVSKLIYK